MTNKFTEEEKKIAEKIFKSQKTFSERYPIVIALSGAFGIVSIFYGFEKLIDRVDLFADNPWILLATGVTVLALTGTFYNKLK